MPSASTAPAIRPTKRSFRTMWMARGGGFYAIGVVVTFVWLEIRTIATEIAASDSLAAFFAEELLEFLLRFSLQSIGNSIQALLWPVVVIERYAAWGAVVLGAGFLLFDALLKKPLTAWLFDGDDAAPREDNANDGGAG